MGFVYCTESLQRIPDEYFAEGKAIWSGGLPYFAEQAARLGLKPDDAPPNAPAAPLSRPASTDLAPDSVAALAAPPTPHPISPELRAEILAKFRKAHIQQSDSWALIIYRGAQGGQPAKPPMRVKLNLNTSAEAGLTLGRGGSFAPVFKSNIRISRRHCLIWIDNGIVLVRDLVSANNSFIDGVLLAPNHDYPLLPGQLLTLGAKHSETRMMVESVKPETIDENFGSTLRSGAAQAAQP